MLTDLSNLWMKNWNGKYKSRTSLFISWINWWGRILIRYLVYRLTTQRPAWFKFWIYRKDISLLKEIKYVKRSKSSFDDFSAKHMLSATLSIKTLLTYIIVSVSVVNETVYFQNGCEIHISIFLTLFSDFSCEDIEQILLG